MTSPAEFANKIRAIQAAANVSPQPPVTTGAVTTRTASFNTSGFAYGGDVGVPSFKGIELLARASGLEVVVVSSFRADANGYHKANAVDFGGSQALQRQLSAFFYQFYAYILELIHTDPGVQGGGFYVHNGKRVPQSFYGGRDIDTGGSIIEGHRNHVHLAMTMSGLRAASANSEAIAQQGRAEIAAQKPPPAGQNSNLLTGEPLPPTAKKKGCVLTAAMVLAPIAALPYGLWQLVSWMV